MTRGPCVAHVAHSNSSVFLLWGHGGGGGQCGSPASCMSAQVSIYVYILKNPKG